MKTEEQCGFDNEVGRKTFYLKIREDDCKEGISKITVTAIGQINKTKSWDKEVMASYKYSEHYQRVRTHKYFKIDEEGEGSWKDKKLVITWGGEATGDKSSLRIIKRDVDTGETLSDVPIYISGNNYSSMITTDGNGEGIVEDLEKGTYEIVERENPHYGYTKLATTTVEVGSGMTSCTLYNERQTGNLKIIKEDKDSKKRLPGFAFKIIGPKGYIIPVVGDEEKEIVMGSVDLDDLHYSSDGDEATTFITDSNGMIEIRNILIGQYYVREIGVDGSSYGIGIEVNNADYYEIDDNYIFWESNIDSNGKGAIARVEVNRRSVLSNNADTVLIKNRRKYIDIKGFVWQDIVPTGKDTDKGNGLYQDGGDDNRDRLLQGMTVKLLNEDGDVAKVYGGTNEQEVNGRIDAITKTEADGSYLFKGVKIDELPFLKIEFSYNGMCYESVIPQTDKDNGSKAAEGQNRTDFNSNYETITYQKSNAYDLRYETSEHESKILYGDKSKYNYGYTDDSAESREHRGPVTGVDDQYMITADTYNGYNGKYLGEVEKMTPDTVRKGGLDVIENINLGIEAREQPDMSLVKDLYSIKVGINGVTHVYQYADRYKPSLWSDPYNMSPQVKFEQEYGNMSYTRALYSSDVYATEEETDDTLRVKVTYKIGIKSSSPNLTTVINEIEDYYDNKYLDPYSNDVKIGTQIDGMGDIIEGTELEKEAVNSGNSQYYKMKIKGPIEVKDQKESSIYIQLEINPTRIISILGDKDKLSNTAEITSYSTRKGGAVYAAIDQDSQPGNLEIGNTSTYEDDTDKAPGLQLVLQEERKINGKVFIDSTTGKLMTAQIRQGNGEYDNNEPGVSEVTVRLIDLDANKVAKIYNESTGIWDDAIKHTDANGDFIIGGFLPDNYQVVYTWGGQTYIYTDENGQNQEQKIRVQDYKGTIYKESEQRENNLEWYKLSGRYSDAKDNYETRQAIDNQSNMVIHSNKMTIINYNDNGKLQLIEGGTENLITQMDSNTPTFRVNIEYSRDPTDVSKEYETNSDGTIKMNGMYAVKQEAYRNHLRDIDFGIVERARQVLRLDKAVEKVKITLANGTVLVDATIVEDQYGNKSFKDNVKAGVYLPKSKQANGQIKFEIDNEIVQGAHVEMTYSLKVTNVGELDYINQEYYWYGNGQNEKDIVRLTADNIIDYLDNDIVLDTEREENKIGSIINNHQEKMQLMDNGLLKHTSEMATLLTQTQKLFSVDAFKEKLTPIETSDTKTQAMHTFMVNKLLSNISINDEMIFDNNAEIVKTIKTGGSSLITIPGDYVSGLSQTDYDDDEAESIVIVPPTGLNMNYIAYIVLIISSLGILVLGIITIKKFVLK